MFVRVLPYYGRNPDLLGRRLQLEVRVKSSGAVTFMHEVDVSLSVSKDTAMLEFLLSTVC